MITRRKLVIGAAAGLTAADAGRPARAQLAPAVRSDANEITVAVPSLGQFRAQQRRIANFMARSGIRVRMVFLSADQLRERIASDVAAGGGADIVFVADSWMAQLGDKLLPLDERLGREGMDLARYPKVFRGGVEFDRAVRGLPVRGFTQLLFYRQDLFKRERLASPATWEDMLNAAVRLQREQNIGGVAMYYGRSPNMAGVALWLNFLWGRGGELFDRNWIPRFSDAAGQQATQIYLDVMLRYEVAVSGAVKFKESDAVAAMAQGRAAILPAWGWHVSGIANPRTRLTQDQVGIAAMPGYRGRVPTPCASMGMLSILARSTNHDAAWEYLKWAASADLEMTIVSDRSTPEQFEEVVVHSASLAAAAVNPASNGYHAATQSTLEHARLLPRLQQWVQVAEILDATLAEAAIGQRLLRTTLEDGARQVEQLLRRDGVIKS